MLLSKFVILFYRIFREFSGKRTHLAMFSKIKYINAKNDRYLREKIFKATFKDGFLVRSNRFEGVSKTTHFPVGFLIWDMSNKEDIDAQLKRIEEEVKSNI